MEKNHLCILLTLFFCLISRAESECPSGTFGYYCRRTCHCKDNSKCNKIDGRCPDQNCASGYTGEKCQYLCGYGFFGENCKSECHCAYNRNCNHIDGKCSDGLCAAGYYGDNCQEECPHGKYGYNCGSTCHCADNSNCDKTNGACSDKKCEKGYAGWNCQKECPHGRSGDNCQDGCNCQSPSHCTSATCTCAQGWNGANCNVECRSGTFGSNCKKTCHCADNSKCDKKNGRCSDNKCARGYRGWTCQTQCPSDTFGNECKKCHCEDNSKCNKTDGTCSDQKCEKGYTGEKCQDLESSLTLPLVLVGVIIIIISIGFGIAFFRWKKSKKRNVCNNQEYENIPMERGNFQETQTREDIDPENIYDVTYELTKNSLLSYVQQNKKDEVPFATEFSTLSMNISRMDPNSEISLLSHDHSPTILTNQYKTTNLINFQGESNYIATQGPLKATTNDFWRMIWQEGCNTIVMLTDIVENKKVKCCCYWPDLNETKIYGTFQICCIEEQRCMPYTHRVLTITQSSTQEKRSVHHFHCTIWPDYGVIEDPTLFLEFRNAIRHSRFSKPPFVVHCSTGTGRTGSFIIMDILLENVRKTQSISVFSCVEQICSQRGLMLITLEQYQFVYDVLAEEVLTGFSEILVKSISDEFRKLQTTEEDGNMSMLQKDFEKYISPLNLAASDRKELIHNKVKKEDLPEPIFLDGFNMKNEIILLAHPSENTAEIFWEFIYKRKCSVIVMFEDSSNSDSLYENTNIDCTYEYNTISVKVTEEIDNGTYTEKKICVSSREEDKHGPVSLVYITIKIWQGEQPPSPAELLGIINTVNGYKSKGKQLLIHCKDGISKSGIFAVLCILISKMEINAQVSIVSLLRLTKKRNPQIAFDFDAYKLCWSVAQEFQDIDSNYDDATSVPIYLDL